MQYKLTREVLIDDLMTLSGLSKEEAEEAADYIFEHEDPHDIGIVICEDRDRWIELLEIGLDHGSDN